VTSRHSRRHDFGAPTVAATSLNAGFTLLEVLVALTVLSLLFFGLMQGSHFVLFGWDRQTRLVAQTEDLDAVDRTLRRLIAQASPGSQWEPLIFAGTAHSAKFTSIVPRPAVGLPAQRADVELVVGPAHRLLLLWTPHFHAINVGRSPPAASTEILDGVDRLDLAYWPAPDGGGWTPVWHDEAPPGLVRIRIFFSDPAHRRWPDILAAPMLHPP
jgi:general secretion pathway protein J